MLEARKEGKTAFMVMDKWLVVSVAKRLRRRVGMRKIPGSIPVVGTALTCSHQPTQLSILLGSANEYQGYSF